MENINLKFSKNRPKNDFNMNMDLKWAKKLLKVERINPILLKNVKIGPT